MHLDAASAAAAYGREAEACWQLQEVAQLLSQTSEPPPLELAKQP